MEARREWPDEAFIPSRIVLRNAEFDRVVKLISKPRKLHLSVTYVAVVHDRVLGFATVTPATIERERIPARRRLPAYPLPVLRLARLAVDRSARAAGIGQQLLAFVLGLANRQRDTLGCVGVLTDAKPEATTFYEKYGFAALGAISGDPVAMFLSIDSIP